MTVCPNCKGSVPDGATLCPSCGEPRRAVAPETATGKNAGRFWIAFAVGFAISMLWVFEAASAWSKDAASARATFSTWLGVALLLIPIVLLVATYVPAVPERFRTRLARRFATGLLVGLLAPFVSGFGVIVGVLGACFGSPL